MVHRFLPALLISLALGGCLESTGSIGPIASGSAHDVGRAQVAIGITTAKKVSVGVIDDRPEVVSGGKSVRFIGTEQGPWAQTLDTKTKNGKGLAAALTGVIVKGLGDAGIPVVALPHQPSGTPDAQAVAAFQAQGTDRLLLVKIDEWRTDSYTRVYLTWNLEAEVFDRQGVMLGHTSVQGRAPVGGTTAEDSAEQITRRQVSRRLGDLLNEPRITDALK